MLQEQIQKLVNLGIDPEIDWNINSKVRLLNKLGIATFLTIIIMIFVRIASSPVTAFTSLWGLFVIILVFAAHSKHKYNLAKHIASFGFPIMLFLIIYAEGASFGEFIIYLLCITLSYILYEDNPFYKNLSTLYNLALAIGSYLYVTKYFPGSISSNTFGSICLFTASIFAIHFLMSFYQLEITRKNHEKEKLISSIGDKNIELERFAHITSHDLKEPLRNIVSFAELSLKSHQQNKSDKTAEYLEIIKTNAYQMHNLVSETLEMISYDKEFTKIAKVDLNEIIEIVKELLAESLSRENIVINSDDSLPTILSHKNEMISLFKNIIENGIKYNENIIPTITIASKRVNEKIIITIKDNGIGIKEQYKDSIFEMYKRLSNKSKISGSGLGLAICKKIVEKLNGNIWIESEFGFGSTFFISIPDNLVLED